MHWSDRIAQEIIRRRPDKEEYVCAAGISPSGSIHIGNFRDIATSYFVVKALRRQGKKARLLFSWDEFDRLRKIPVNVAKLPRPEGEKSWEEYIGYPYVDVPNPFDDGCPNYAKHFEVEFEEAMERFGIHMDYRYQAQMNRSGKYAEYVIQALKKRGEIFDILDSFRTQAAQEGEKEAYYPVSIYCPHCKRDTTKILSLSEDCTVAEYECSCGHKGTFDFTKDFNCKLAWKIDWPMRWMYEGVDFEPGGKDHASPGGSYDTSRVISQKIFGYEAPLFQGYEFIGIKGATGKMSGSSGLNLTPDTLLKLYQPEMILWLYAKSEPTKAFDFCFDDGILRQYFEFDKQYNEFMDGKADEFLTNVMANCLREDEEGTSAYKKIETVPMSLLVQLGSVVDFNVPMLETVFEKIGQPFTYDQFKDRLERAKYWLEQCSPENVNRLRPYRNWEVYEALSEEEKKEIALLHDYIKKGGYSLDELNQELYAIPKQVMGDLEDAKELKKIQGQFFKNVYRLLIDKEKGPRLYLFLYAIEPDKYVNLLDFSTPMTEEEKQPQVKEETAEEESSKKQVVLGDPDPVEPVRDEITIDDFTKIDMRVCKILKCAEIRKSHSCYKLTLFDGLKERVIVSSIKSYYTPDEMVGKKIIVIANLKPARFAGVTSDGMLLAATNNACGCQVIFVDDMVPEGTRIC
ncbi:lysine--tRNA ligase [Eisenbergiella tayi]|uniref:Lysine--tRNA ligase n=1 Tax=Eisenbergiella tayi TaxID=1432052 RepID=A0A1E3AMF7_9FIRM|nr:lysine--tRNA ligase [Eisenbergiella tayi]ODM09859.1 Lysine--tRNA ligase [Eisenbergiella tayi]OIZ63581.1 lysine--tRNA ligase [Eisenbergiella tayi]